MTFYNIATGQYLNECDFYALVKDTNYTCCSQSENVWIAQPNNLAFNEYQWQQYFLSHVPSCGSPYTLTLRYSAGNAPMQSLNDWNTQLAGNYTAVSVIGNDVILTGGSGVDIPASALIDSNLVQVTDDGSVNSMGDNCLAGGSIANLVLSAAVSVGNGLLGNCPLSNIELPACTALGSTSGNDGIFTGISGQSISAIFNIALATNNAGQPDGDILDLYANNDVTTQWDTAPVNTVAPAITGTNSVGSVLTCSTGTWTYLGDISYAYQWRRGGSPIGGATASTYTLVTADGGNTIDCVVTATTSAGSTPQASSNSYAVPLPYLLDSYATNTAYAWSVARQLKNTATVAIRIRRSNDNAETDIGFSGGALNTAAITSFVGANSAFITRIYEQVGSGYNWQQTTAANQFRIVNAGTLHLLNTKPTAVCDIATSCRMTIPSSTTYFLFMRDGTESSLFSVYKKGITTTSSRALIATSNTGVGGTNNGWGVLNWTDGKTYIQAYQSSSNNYNGTAAASTPDAQALLTFYVDANNATASQRTTGYLNGGSPVNDNTQNWGTYSGNNNVDFSLGNGLTASTPISRFQELILLPSQPTLATFRTNINTFYNIYP
jgi:hypothetical protein